MQSLPMWVRQGTCQPKECGSACCKFIWLEINPAYHHDPDISSWIRLHGIEMTDHDGRTFARIPLPCTALGNDGRCSIYGAPDRPDLCAAFPAAPASLAGLDDVCTYTFERRAV